jgi:putative hydrolase of the HAD superfamily
MPPSASRRLDPSSLVTAVIFDVDGTLVDHDRAQRDGLTAHLATQGHDPLDEALWTRWRTLEERHFSRYLSGELGFQEQRRCRVRDFTGQPYDDATADAWFAGYQEQFEASWHLFPDVGVALEALSALPLAAFSNVPGDLTRRKIAAVGLADVLEVVLGTDDVGAAKPHARVFTSVCAALGSSATSTWHVGDRYYWDGMGARDAGLRSVWLDRPGADPVGRVPPPEVTDPGADGVAVVSSLLEFATLVSGTAIG